ncbi:sensor histidine kinase (plasmid) [Rhizobium laguerreae]|uniref:sensor histidine kinase n=1 Tax=Rhizobium laguerreae TaxID=1076926 RepID=UPI001C920A48|nr:sensor histidine kinase [Rhizobium laguerreae]MBY3257135.1 sensor histidine kinase [Rhizobium laguerreae]MBY3284482.1 sensor histidine kinase [Rhizobium laguerreae]MBY3290453.1 sensor histidine kinase [Rhizobium laguerreae]MBY3535957.1 sensor histidine kinase [Rhizobium laguerreae]UFW67820.1 sensor histidine kinase [Rhizobium laguerreae]
MNESQSESELDWVLVLAPFRRDADYIAAFLREQKIGVVAAKVDDDLSQHLVLEPAIIVVTNEALDPNTVAKIAEHLSTQPDWSEVPIIILLERSAPLAAIRTRLQSSWPGSRLLFHMRPIAPLELVNVLQSNLLVRLRQRQVRDAFERERGLRLELNHRVKNILASVTSIFQMTKRGAATVDDLAREFTGRLEALSNVHTAVFEAGGEEISLLSIVSLTVAPYRSNDSNRIDFTGPDLAVTREAGTVLALCLHELTTNAIKYGALSLPDGKVKVSWTIAGSKEPVFSIDWTESDGPPVRPPTRQGYGTRYVRSALGALLGTAPTMTFAAAGFQCSAEGPVSRLMPDSKIV